MTLLKLVLQRLLQACLVVWSIGSLTFVLMRALPGDMAYRIAAGRYGYDRVNSAAAEAVRAELGLDRPALQQYFSWFSDLLHFNLGTSLVSGLPVFEELSHLLSHTLLLASTSMLIAIALALPLGLYCAIKPAGWLDRCALVGSALVRAQPVFIIGLLLILLFALQLQWLPVAGFYSARYLVLPALSLALVQAAMANRVVRNSALGVLQSQYFQFARMKGLSFAQAFRQHALRNLALPVVVFMGVQLVTLIEGVVMIESLFSWPGIGHGLAHAVFNRDVPMIQAAALSMGLLFVTVNLLIDLACAAIDPRTRQQ
jgi:peptide/nickel transport system permease protein